MNFFKLYIGDYQRDTGTLTLAEHGAYMLMLQHLYATERPLPIGKELHRLLRAESAAERRAIDAVARMFWTITPDGLVNNRSMRELAKDAHYRDVNAVNGRKGGRPIKTEPVMNLKTESKPTIAITKTKGDPSPPIVPPLPESCGTSAFDRFWRTYPRRVGKEAARRIFERRRPDEALLAVMLAAIKKQAQTPQWQEDGGKFIPYPATWLNQCRWEDEIAASPTPEATPKWVVDAGFDSVFEAENNRCFERNSHQFRDGKRIEVSA